MDTRTLRIGDTFIVRDGQTLVPKTVQGQQVLAGLMESIYPLLEWTAIETPVPIPPPPVRTDQTVFSLNRVWDEKLVMQLCNLTRPGLKDFNRTNGLKYSGSRENMLRNALLSVVGMEGVQWYLQQHNLKSLLELLEVMTCIPDEKNDHTNPHLLRALAIFDTFHPTVMERLAEEIVLPDFALDPVCRSVEDAVRKWFFWYELEEISEFKNRTPYHYRTKMQFLTGHLTQIAESSIEKKWTPGMPLETLLHDIYAQLSPIPTWFLSAKTGFSYDLRYMFYLPQN